MDWYDDLARYFPRAEMRPRGHFEWLIDHRPEIYRVEATADHLLLYLEYDDVLFIDYLYVYPDHRGAGVGSRVLESLKQHQKAVLLEVEPASPADPDSVRRRQFYDRLQFRQVREVSFRLPHPLLGAGTELDVLCWAPGEVPPERIYQWMRRMYQDLYAGIDPAIYGKPYPPVAECLRLHAPSKGCVDAMSQFHTAAEFLWRNARLLDRRLFAYLFAGGPAAAVLAALQAYQNPDGGFGNALEPDMRCPDSQPVATEMALHYLHLAGGDKATVARVCDYLTTITTAEGGVPKVLPTVMGYPRAPWWQAPAAPPADINPTAGITGLLYALGAEHPWLEGATAYCWRIIETAELDRPHDFLSIMRFLSHVPDRERAGRNFERMAARMIETGAVALDPRATGYVKLPLDWAPTPDALCRRLFADDLIAAHLDALAARQAEDGGWPISWPSLSPANLSEWRGRVTLDALITLRAYGRMPDCPGC